MLAFGFSTTANPTTAADWCRYNLGYGADFPDYPKLGDTKDFALIGANVYGSAGQRSLAVAARSAFPPLFHL